MKILHNIKTVIILFFLSLNVSVAIANDVAIYESYYSGMPIADVRKRADAVEVAGVPNVRLMRRGERFANAEWMQLFAFGDDALTDVILHAEYSPSRCDDAFSALLARGYLPIFIKDGTGVVNLAKLWSPDGQAFADAASDFEPGSASAAELTFLDAESFMAVARGVQGGEGWTTVAEHLPENARAAFLTIDKNGNGVTLSFFAPKEQLSLRSPKH